MGVKTIDDRQLRDDTLGSLGTVLVDFWAPWCAPCRAMKPILAELAAELEGCLTVATANVDADPGWADSLEITGIPTLVLFAGGVEVDRVVGVHPKWVLRSWLEPHLEGDEQ